MDKSFFGFQHRPSKVVLLAQFSMFVNLCMCRGSQGILGQAAAFIISSASETEADLRSLFHVWTWTSKAFKGGMVDSSWLPPNISRAMWHGSIFEGTKVWQTALLNIRLVYLADRL